MNDHRKETTCYAEVLSDHRSTFRLPTISSLSIFQPPAYTMKFKSNYNQTIISFIDLPFLELLNPLYLIPVQVHLSSFATDFCLLR